MSTFRIKRECLKKYEGKELAGVLYTFLEGAEKGPNEKRWIAGLTKGQRIMVLLKEFDCAFCCGVMSELFLEWRFHTTNA